MTATKSKLTKPQLEFVRRVPTGGPRDYFVLKIHDTTEKQVAFRAMRKLGWKGYYTGGRMYLWRHEETPLEKLVRRTYFYWADAVKRRHHWQSDYPVRRLRWLVNRYPELQVWYVGNESLHFAAELGIPAPKGRIQP